ncbi:MAG: serine hydroxymethyltransferase [Candidatus Saccharibacteria bacterium]
MIHNQELQRLVEAEEARQLYGLELIPSENYVSRDVLEALGSVFTNKYSEGYPGRRYYGGQQNTDQVEIIAIESAKQLFNADHANVQPHSGAQANESVYHAWLDPGDTVLAMDLSHGGHLTHGHPKTVLTRFYNFVHYRIKNIDTGEIDFNDVRELAKKYKPKIILAGYSSYPRDLNYAKFAEIGNEVGAVLMADVAHTAGLIAGGVMANPFDAGFHVLSSTTHKTLRGPRSGIILSKGNASNPLVDLEKTIENLPTIIDRTVFPGVQGGPHMNTILAKAVAFNEAMKPEFKVYVQNVVDNAKKLAEELMNNGAKLVTNGTDNHMMLIDVIKSYNIDGNIAEKALDKAGLTVNKNVIPDDPQTLYSPSGIRLGTPAITTRGFTTEHMPQLASWITGALNNYQNDQALAKIKSEVSELARQFPLPSNP